MVIYLEIQINWLFLRHKKLTCNNYRYVLDIGFGFEIGRCSLACD